VFTTSGFASINIARSTMGKKDGKSNKDKAKVEAKKARQHLKADKVSVVVVV